jgi:hypothetical protein
VDLGLRLGVGQGRSILGLGRFTELGLLLGLNPGAGLDDRQVMRHLHLGGLGLQLHLGPSRLGLGLGELPLDALELLDVGQLAPLAGQGQGVLDDVTLGVDQQLLNVSVLHLDLEDLHVVDAHRVL